jgi:hypothetical protein
MPEKSEMPVPCEGCGQVHGPVNVQMNCLRYHLRVARDLLGDYGRTLRGRSTVSFYPSVDQAGPSPGQPSPG